MVTFESFKQSLKESNPPSSLPVLLKAMWFEGKGDWHTAHELAQDVHTREGSWIHAYLHRKEGDVGNAGYWYSRAGRSMPTQSLEKEWESITRELLADR
ncbi:hypothetical protein WBG78_21270 [Chryseolinea sp. T2]|uniref:hypothetical protein n=1 Tax=Chryseolinea sp. T2 TaxID=3129255 RepID=UPI003077C47C